jgi:hypothetical protein
MPPSKVILVVVAIILTAYGLITESSLYEGIRANQKMKTEDPATKQLSDHDTYKKGREQIQR